MELPFYGSWRSLSSDLPNYIPGEEILHFNESGEHVLELPPGKAWPIKSLVHFRLLADSRENGYIFCQILKSGAYASRVWPIGIELISSSTIMVSPHYRYKTLFERL